MGEKSQQKKQFIVEKAREVFREKGYKKVTMKDVIEACDISRGGLYLYFASTKEIFQEVIKLEQEAGEDVFASEVNENSTPRDILRLFLVAQKKEILGNDGSMTTAIYEYCFEHHPKGEENFMYMQYTEAVKAIEQLIAMGVEEGEFYCEDPEAVAEHFMITFEGIKISKQAMDIKEEVVDRQIEYLMSYIEM